MRNWTESWGLSLPDEYGIPVVGLGELLDHKYVQ